MTDDELRAAVAATLPGVRADLERLVAIPSIAFDGFDHSHVERVGRGRGRAAARRPVCPDVTHRRRPAASRP